MLGQDGGRGRVRGAAAEDQGRLPARVRDAPGRVGENTQTAYALALQFDLLPEDLRAGGRAPAGREVRTRGHLTTGFVGTPYLCHVLSALRPLDAGLQAAEPRGVPVLALPREAGRHHDLGALGRAEARRQLPERRHELFNHYAYGAIGEWMYRVVAGLELDPAEPGYKHVLVQPQPGGGLTSAEARLETPLRRGTRPAGRSKAGS